MIVAQVKELLNQYGFYYSFKTLEWNQSFGRYNLAMGPEHNLFSDKLINNELYWFTINPDRFDRYPYSGCSYAWMEQGTMMTLCHNDNLDESVIDPLIHEQIEAGVDLPSVMRWLCL